METILMAAGAAVAYLIAYHTYGKYLSRRIFGLDNARATPAVTLEDGCDYVPTHREILFGHHYTSIAGTGPIVGPAIAIIWGWVPALVWVIVGSIFMGAVHDFGALVVSARNRGRSIGDIAREIINPRVRLMFLAIVALILCIVIAVFCLVIAILFHLYPQSVLPVWCEIPIALLLGHAIYRWKIRALPASIGAVALMYVTVVIGAYVPIVMPPVLGFPPVVAWSVLLLIYGFVASVLPVWRLLQPRDYINGHELFIAMALLSLGVIFAHPDIVAPAVDLTPEGAPPLWPFLFITIACGAISGFHSLVASGTTSKQLGCEQDARFIGYGGMLLEGMLAVFVIIAVAAGLGMAVETEGGGVLHGVQAWKSHYASWGAAAGLPKKVGAFVDGSANMLGALGIPAAVALGVMGVFVASFAGTTIDTATRLQRYVVSEIAGTVRAPFLANRYAATTVAVVTGGFLALLPQPDAQGRLLVENMGKGGLILWPLFGATNQLLGCLALLVVTVYLRKKGKSIVYTLVPMIFLFVMTGWAMLCNLGDYLSKDVLTPNDVLLFVIGLVIVVLEIWMVVESFLVLLRPPAGPARDAPASPA